MAGRRMTALERPMTSSTRQAVGVDLESFGSGMIESVESPRTVWASMLVRIGDFAVRAARVKAEAIQLREWKRMGNGKRQKHHNTRLTLGYEQM
jgi:hypothetical protein